MNINLAAYANEHFYFCRQFLDDKSKPATPPKSETLIYPPNERSEHSSLKLIMSENMVRGEKALVNKKALLASERSEIYKSNQASTILKSNLKKFGNKIKKYGNLNKVSVLKPKDLKIINDQSYFEEQEEKIWSKHYLKNNDFFSNILCSVVKPMNFFLKRVVCHNISLIHPYSKSILLWQSLISLLTLFLMFYIPLSLAFGLNFIEDNQKIVFLLIFVIDMFLEINTRYFNNGLEVYDRKKIMINYIEGYFIPDIISVSSLFFQIELNSDLSSLIKGTFCFLFFLKVFSLMKFSKKITNRFHLSRKWKGVKDLIVLFLLIIFIAHLAACGWYYVGVNSIDSNSRNWINEKELMEEDWHIKYMSSFYWSIVTVMTVGYGDITPANNNERFYCLFVILFGGMIFPYSINSIGNIIQDIKRDQKRFEYLKIYS